MSAAAVLPRAGVKAGIAAYPYYMDKIKSALARLRPSKAALLSSAAALMIILLLTDPAAYLQSALDSLTLFALSAAKGGRALQKTGKTPL